MSILLKYGFQKSDHQVSNCNLKSISHKVYYLSLSGPAKPGCRGCYAQSPPPPAAPHFCAAKRKKGNKGKKERVLKQKLLKGSHQGQNITVLPILKRIEFKNLSCRLTLVADNTFQCSMAPPLWNPFRPPWPWKYNTFVLWVHAFTKRLPQKSQFLPELVFTTGVFHIRSF